MPRGKKQQPEEEKQYKVAAMPDIQPMWEDDEETLPDNYPFHTATGVPNNPVLVDAWDLHRAGMGNKESRENFIDTKDFVKCTLRGLMKTNLEPQTSREEMLKQVKGSFQDTLSCYLTSQFPDGVELSAAEVAQAFRDALADEAAFYQRMAERCEQFRQAEYGTVVYDEDPNA